MVEIDSFEKDCRLRLEQKGIKYTILLISVVAFNGENLVVGERFAQEELNKNYDDKG